MQAGVDQKGKRTSFWRALGVILCVNAASALSVLLLHWSLEEGMTGGQLARGFITSITYANCIGMLMALVMPWAAPHFARQRFPLSWVLYIGTILVLSLFGTSLAVLVLTRTGIFPPGLFWSFYRSSLVVAIVIALAIGVSRYFYERVKHRLEVATAQLQLKELEEERARKLAAEARLSSLESRIHPHFLFNTLNSISALIQEDPIRAERMVERLAGLLRFSLDSNQASTVTLGSEVKVVADYLEIEKARFGEQLRFSIEIPPELRAAQVPPLSVQTLVENSVKHSVSVRRAGGEIRVGARCEGDLVRVRVWDDGAGFTRDAIASGHGLDNLQGRLTALFGKAGSIQIGGDGLGSSVTISVPRTGAERQAIT